MKTIVNVMERTPLSKGHWYGFLPRRLQYYVAHIGVKLGLVHSYNRLGVTVNHPDGTFTRVSGYNIVVDEGIKRLGDILADVETTDIALDFIEPGSGSTTPVIGDTDVETALTPADRKPTSLSRSATTPFEVVASFFIASNVYLSRPQTIRELCVYFEDDPSGVMYARGLLATAITLNANDTATISYGVVFR